MRYAEPGREHLEVSPTSQGGGYFGAGPQCRTDRSGGDGQAIYRQLGRERDSLGLFTSDSMNSFTHFSPALRRSAPRRSLNASTLPFGPAVGNSISEEN